MRWRNPPFRKVTLSAQSVANISAVCVRACAREIRSLFKMGDGAEAGKPRKTWLKQTDTPRLREGDVIDLGHTASEHSWKLRPPVACLASSSTGCPQSIARSYC